MANKYIRHGETYCGDGTTSAAAASNGGVGAWNNINVHENSSPAYGALVAGDVVSIRSKDAAGADITRTLAANINVGSTAGTAANPIAWVIDGGTVWSGISGVVTYQTGGSYTATYLAGNIISADVQDAYVIKQTNNWPGAQTAIFKGVLRKAKIDISIINQSSTGFIIDGVYGVVLEDCYFKMGLCTYPRFAINGWTTLTLINPDIEITYADASQYLFWLSSYYGSIQLEIFYGRIRGSGAGSQTTLITGVDNSSSGSYRVKAIGLKFPTDMPVANPASTISRTSIIDMVGLDGVTGAHIQENWGWATSRTDNNPPVLSAQLPNSSLSLWAWRLYPYAASEEKPARLPSAKVYTGDPATKTITFEFLVANTLTVSKKNVWMTVNYIDDSTGLPKSISSRDFSGSSLDVSTAAWNVTTWGLVTCDKKKMTVTTPAAIKKDTLVTVTFWCTKAAASGNDIFFLDHDFAVI